VGKTALRAKRSAAANVGAVTAAKLGAAVILAAALACGRGPADYGATRRAMGTAVYARAVAADEATARDAVEAAFAAVARAERTASFYDAASELAALNRAGAEEPFPVSAELYELVALAREAAAATDGYFDPTVASLVEAYGIKGGAPRWPEEEELAVVMERVGYEGMALVPEKRAVGFARPGMILDLSGIAKGWAVDRAAAAMAAAGARAGLVEAGGEVVCFGGGPRKGEEWKVGVQDPEGEGLYATFELGAGACATSGGYAQRFEAEGHTFSHLFDPRTGRPAEGAASVTVVAATCAEADAWATALAVMPAAEAGRLVKRHGRVACLILRWDKGILKPVMHGEFPKIDIVEGSE
jgi:thiamine biosynthesis lipoprotein